MADPFSAPMLALYGAGIGAATNKKDPLMGAALGGLGGYFLGPMAGKALGAGAGALGSTVSPMQSAAMGVGMEAMAGGVTPEVAAQMAANAAAMSGTPSSAGMYMAAMQNPTAAGLIGTPTNAASGGLFANAKNFLGQEGPLGLGSRGDWLGAAGKVSGMGQPQQPQNAVMSSPFAMQQTPPSAFASLGPNADLLEKQGALFGRPINNLGRLPRV